MLEASSAFIRFSRPLSNKCCGTPVLDSLQENEFRFHDLLTDGLVGRQTWERQQAQLCGNVSMETSPPDLQEAMRGDLQIILDQAASCLPQVP